MAEVPSFNSGIFEFSIFEFSIIALCSIWGHLHQNLGKCMPDAGVLATILLIAGLFLLILEFFIPSFGMIGIIAIVCLAVSSWSAWQAWGGGRNPVFFRTFVFFLVCGIPGTLSLGLYLLQYSAVGRAIVLQPPKLSATVNPLEQLVGKRGLTQTMLTPGGMVEVQKNRYHAESLGMLIDPNSPIIVVDVRNNRLVVRPVTAETEGSDEQTEDQLNDDSGQVAEPLVAESEKTSTKRPEPDQPQNHNAATKPDQKPAKLDFDIPEYYTA